MATDNYVEAVYWRLTSDPRRVVIANLLGGVSVPLAIGVFGLLGTVVTGLPMTYWLTMGRASADIDASTVAAIVVTLTVSIACHELTHGLAIRLCGRHPRYGFQWAGLIPYATAPGQLFTRDQYVAVALAPLIGLSLLGAVVFVASPAWLAPWMLLGLVGNAAGAVGDVWMSAIALRYPRSARIMDERDGMRIFVNRAA
jgi:hypothetical protein